MVTRAVAAGAVSAVVALVAGVLAVAAAPPAGAAGFEVIRTVAGGGAPEDGVGDGGPATDAALSGPQKVAADGAGGFYIADGNRVRHVDAAGIITTVAGDGTFPACDPFEDPECDPFFTPAPGDGGPAVEAQVIATGVAVGPDGDLYIAGGQRVRKVDAATGIITTVAGTGEFGSSGDGGPATEAMVANPQGIELDAAGSLYIAEEQGKVVREVDPSGIITTVAGNYFDCVVADGVPATDACLDFPYDVDVDVEGNLFIADPAGNLAPAIRRVDAATGIITTVAGGGTPADGVGDGGPATDAALISPTGVAVDIAGNIYIADGGSSRIRRVDAATGIITTVAGTGVPGFSGDGGPPREAQLGGPSGVELDATLGLLIADRFNQRVRQVVTVPDLVAVIKTDSPDPVNVGQELTYTVEVTNNAAVAATGVTVTDVLPAEVTFTAATPTQGTCSAVDGTVTCELGTMAAGATATVAIVVTPTATGSITNTATVTADGDDPFPGNNTATAETAVGDRGCGQVITRTTRLSEDIGPCPGNGIVIGADGITLNLNGHTVFGFEGPSRDGNAAGIRFPARHRASVVNGTVSGFDAGVVINLGASNHVRNMTITGNVGPDDAFNAELGDGIAVFDSPSNRIVNNVIVGNGIFDGIGVLGAAADTTVIWGNTVEDTVGPSDLGPAGQGIIVNAAGLGVNDGALIVGTIIRYNVVRGNASAGIANINNVDAQIRANVVEGNGLTNQQGNGIGLQLGPGVASSSSRAFVQGNEVHGNGGDGIHVRLGSLDNVIVGNNAADNNAATDSYFRSFDLRDYNPGCGTNVWRGNTWGSGFYAPACTAFRGSGPAPVPEPEVFEEATCFDDYDNDQDGLIDGDDPDCNPPPEGPEGDPTCSDGVDNDLDSRSDLDDPDCNPPTPEGPAGDDTCFDAHDNDRDGFTDFLDPGCGSEGPAGDRNCLDGLDNDDDGLVDAADPDCAARPVAPAVGALAAGETASGYGPFPPTRHAPTDDG